VAGTNIFIPDINYIVVNIGFLPSNWTRVAWGPWEESQADALAGGKCPAGTVAAIRQPIDLLELPVDGDRQHKRVQTSSEVLQQHGADGFGIRGSTVISRVVRLGRRDRIGAVADSGLVLYTGRAVTPPRTVHTATEEGADVTQTRLRAPATRPP
jgi:hypothetical protein